MNDRSNGDEAGKLKRSGHDDAPDEHERQVIAAQEDATGERQDSSEGSTNRYTGSSGEPYEAELQAEREGTTAAEVEQQDAEPHGEASRWFTG